MKRQSQTDAQSALERALARREASIAALVRNDAVVKALRQKLRRMEKSRAAVFGPPDPAVAKAGALTDRILRDGVNKVFPKFSLEDE